MGPAHVQTQESIVQDQESEVKTRELKQPILKGPKNHRNDPCPCGSGLKFKKCCKPKKTIK